MGAQAAALRALNAGRGCRHWPDHHRDLHRGADRHKVLLGVGRQEMQLLLINNAGSCTLHPLDASSTTRDSFQPHFCSVSATGSFCCTVAPSSCQPCALGVPGSSLLLPPFSQVSVPVHSFLFLFLLQSFPIQLPQAHFQAKGVLLPWQGTMCDFQSTVQRCGPCVEVMHTVPVGREQSMKGRKGNPRWH